MPQAPTWVPRFPLSRMGQGLRSGDSETGGGAGTTVSITWHRRGSVLPAVTHDWAPLDSKKAGREKWSKWVGAAGPSGRVAPPVFGGCHGSQRILLPIKFHSPLKTSRWLTARDSPPDTSIHIKLMWTPFSARLQLNYLIWELGKQTIMVFILHMKK